MSLEKIQYLSKYRALKCMSHFFVIVFEVMNGHTSCVRLLLDDPDGADLVDAADSQGQ